MKNTRKLLSLLMVLAMLLSLLAACGSSSDETESTTTAAGVSDGSTEATESNDVDAGFEQIEQSTASLVVNGEYLIDTITASCSSDGGTFDPFSQGNWGDCIVGDLMFQRLANLDAYGVLHNCMMKSYEMIDETHYRITIWDCIHDSAGNPITADDVIWSYQVSINSGRGGAINKFDHFEKEDDYNLIMVLSSPFSDGEFDKHVSTLQVLSEAAYLAAGEDMSANPVGTGPYVMTGYVVGSSITFTADENYWMRDLPEEAQAEVWMYDAQNVRVIEYQIIQDAATRAIALEMGTIDIADSLNNADVDAFETNDAISIINLPQTAPLVTIFNCSENSICSDVLIRQAIAYAIDSSAIAEGCSTPCTAATCILPKQVDTPDEWLNDTDYFAYNLEKAQELMEEAGYNGETIKIIYSDGTPTTDVVIQMQSQLKAAGFNCEIEAMDMSNMRTAQYDSTAYDIRLQTLGGGYYIANAIKYFTAAEVSQSLGGEMNWFYLVDDELEALIAAENADGSDENILAQGDYIEDNSLSFAIQNYSLRTACTSSIDASSLYGGKLAPNAAIPVA